MSIKDNLIKNLALGYSFARTTAFAAQGIALPWIDRIASGDKRDTPKNYPEHLKQALPKIQKLLQKDAENMAMGLYPYQVLNPESPLTHSLRMPKIVMDAFRSAKRRNEKINADFDDKANQYLDNLPEYYKRNFHFQTSGYLGEQSAELYEHQVEILFSGAADAMRRTIIPHIKTHIHSLNSETPSVSNEGVGLKFLEIGSGTGRLTKFMAQAFPKAQITSLDLSSVYLAKAKQRLAQFPRIDFVQGAGEEIPFQDKKFDVVYSCFMFHELPFEIRKKVLSESFRVLKSNGFCGLVDSLQENDDADFQWALEQFPKDFHEPFYKNYIKHPLENLFTESKFTNVQSEVAFLSKIVTGVKI